MVTISRSGLCRLEALRVGTAVNIYRCNVQIGAASPFCIINITKTITQVFITSCYGSDNEENLISEGLRKYLQIPLTLQYTYISLGIYRFNILFDVENDSNRTITRIR